MDPILLLFCIFMGSGTLLVALSIPLIRGRIPPNGLYGFRVRRTLENPAVWYPANRYAGWLMLGLGVLFPLAATVLYFVPGMGLQGYAWSCLAVMMVGLALGLFLSFRYLRSLPE